MTGLHGADHAQRVAELGLLLAKATGADAAVVELFARLHDSQRQSDGDDPQHGERAARVIEAVRNLSHGDAELLIYACRYHNAGLAARDITVQACWDADRLDLGRVGKRVDPHRLHTGSARLLAGGMT